VESSGGDALKAETNEASAYETKVLAFYACGSGDTQPNVMSVLSERCGEMREACNMAELCAGSRCVMSEEEERRIQNDDLHTKKLEPQPLRSFTRILENVMHHLQYSHLIKILHRLKAWIQYQYLVQNRPHEIQMFFEPITAALVVLSFHNADSHRLPISSDTAWVHGVLAPSATDCLVRADMSLCACLSRP
jgi:hypothetical protein